MMTARSTIEPTTASRTVTSNNTITTTTTADVVVVVTSGASRLYHTIRTASPPTGDSEVISMKRHRCDPPGRSSDDEEASDDDDNDGVVNHAKGDDASYDWSSISSTDDDDEDRDCIMTDVPSTVTTPTIQQNPSVKRQKVTFGMLEVYEVPSLRNYQLESDTSFWYNTMDMIHTRRAGRLSTMHDASVKNYLYYYEFLYRKLQDSSKNHATTIGNDKELILSELDAKILAYGLRGGYHGLEREGKFEQVRQDERRSIVKQIVKAYKQQNSQPSSENDNRDEALRIYASSLTKTMSQWAMSLGQAAHLATKEG